MSALMLCRGLAGVVVGSTARRQVMENTSHGLPDKSAAFGMAHVVGWIEFLDIAQNRPAGAFSRKISKFNAPTAVAIFHFGPSHEEKPR